MKYSGRESSEVIIVTLSLLGGTASKDFNVNVSALPVSATGKITKINNIHCLLTIVICYFIASYKFGNSLQ